MKKINRETPAPNSPYQVSSLHLVSLAISLGSIVTTMDDQILWAVIVLSAKVALDDSLCSKGITLLGVNGGSTHVWNHSVSTTEGVLGIAERVVFGCGLREPNVTAIATKVAGLKGVGDILLHNDGTAGGVDEP